MEGQIWKWKHASREAIETLYATATEKVNQRGGEWRGLFGRKKWEEEEEPRRGGGWEDEGVGGEEELEKMKEEEVREGEAWGVGVMLRCLGIPEGMVGWDGQKGCWEEIG